MLISMNKLRVFAHTSSHTHTHTRIHTSIHSHVCKNAKNTQKHTYEMTNSSRKHDRYGSVNAVKLTCAISVRVQTQLLAKWNTLFPSSMVFDNCMLEKLKQTVNSVYILNFEFATVYVYIIICISQHTISAKQTCF